MSIYYKIKLLNRSLANVINFINNRLLLTTDMNDFKEKSLEERTDATIIMNVITQNLLCLFRKIAYFIMYVPGVVVVVVPSPFVVHMSCMRYKLRCVIRSKREP
uniref:Uncharacterized protein n=1 Tax=Glossina austeni TaxID=7395 RepID=A0A1A9UJY7_GLOAU